MLGEESKRTVPVAEGKLKRVKKKKKNYKGKASICILK